MDSRFLKDFQNLAASDSSTQHLSFFLFKCQTCCCLESLLTFLRSSPLPIADGLQSVSYLDNPILTFASLSSKLTQEHTMKSH